MTHADRGKVAEGQFQKACNKLSTVCAEFDFERIYDFRASRGGLTIGRAGDFCIYYKGKNILVELKEVDHEFRLPKHNFDRRQRARMAKRQLAGTICQVIVRHSPTDKWRLVPLSFFGFEETGSWDLRAYVEQDLKGIMEQLCQH